MSYWYLGSPYSKYPTPDPAEPALGLEAAHKEVCKEAGRLIAAGIPTYSPIAHTHPIAMHADMDPLDHKIWLPADRPMMDAACGLIVLKMDTWEDSYGLKYEIEVFRKARKPVLYMTPGEEIRQVFAFLTWPRAVKL